jgi:hypothetical protein
MPTNVLYFTGVADVYYQSFAYPERFDQFLADNQSLLDGKFYSCLSSLEQVWKAQAAQDMNICELMKAAWPGWYEKCLSEKESFKVVNWIASLRSVLTGGIKWANTLIGAFAIQAKISNPTGPDAYVQAINSNWPVLQMSFLCK